MKNITLKVSGMMCGGCEKRLKKSLAAITGIKEVSADHKTGAVVVAVEDGVAETVIKAKIEDIGFHVES